MSTEREREMEMADAIARAEANDEVEDDRLYVRPRPPSREDGTATVEHARYGEVVHTRPSPEELDDAGCRIETLRRNLSVLRGEVEQLGRGWAPLAGDDKRYRDVEGLLTAALVLLYDAEVRFPKWAEQKRERLAHPEAYVVQEGFGDECREKALVEVWWWDRYHQRFGPNLVAMPWRTGNIDGKDNG